MLNVFIGHTTIQYQTITKSQYIRSQAPSYAVPYLTRTDTWIALLQKPKICMISSCNIHSNHHVFLKKIKQTHSRGLCSSPSRSLFNLQNYLTKCCSQMCNTLGSYFMSPCSNNSPATSYPD
jgi:hypothetical protein